MAVNDAESNLKRREFFGRYGIADGLRELANRFPFEPRQMRSPNTRIAKGAAA
jgi:type IV secretion system protein VirB4